MDYEPYDSSGTDDDLPPTHPNRIPKGAACLAGMEDLQQQQVQFNTLGCMAKLIWKLYGNHLDEDGRIEINSDIELVETEGFPNGSNQVCWNSWLGCIPRNLMVLYQFNLSSQQELYKTSFVAFNMHLYIFWFAQFGVLFFHCFLLIFLLSIFRTI